MYEIDPVPNSDQTYCDNCETIVDEKMITETITGESGCSECIARCDICFKLHFTQDTYLCPYFGRICNDCVKDNDYKKDVRDKVLKEALRCFNGVSASKILINVFVLIPQSQSRPV